MTAEHPMVYQGIVKNGVVVFKAQPPPEGTGVTVTVAPVPEPSAADAAKAGDDIWTEMEKFAGRAPDLPQDAARNHDHYLYGKPKR
jgi:hypothetical protein